LLTQKEYWIYRVLLYIVVDTERIINIPGLFIKFMYTKRIFKLWVLFIYCCRHRKNIGIYGYYLLIVVDTESKRESMGIFINCCRHRKNIGYIGYYLLIVVDTESKRESTRFIY